MILIKGAEVMADIASSLWSIESTTKSTLSNTKKIQGEVAALTAATAAIYQETKNIKDETNDINQRLNEIEEKTEEIQEMVCELFEQSRRQHLMQMAQTEIVKVRQEREKLYGNYETVRKTTEGILLATDVGIVRQNTIVTSAEELRLSTPRYWLSSCLLALSAWINNDKTTAESAIREALKLDDEKTSLFFALVCRRASRSNACNEWMIRYLRGQDPENLDMRCVFVLDAYANGLLGIAGSNSVFSYMNEWVTVLAQKSDFEQKQIQNWSNVVRSVMKKPDVNFDFIEKYCVNKEVYNTKLLTSHLHGNLFNYLDSIMSVTVDTGLIKEKLDQILKELITLFDDDERVKVYEEKEMEYIIKFKGDEDKARAAIQLDKSQFEETKDFTKILSEAAMGTQDMFNSPSTRKLSVAFCKDWIKNAYNDILAKARMSFSIPLRFVLDDWFAFETTDGRNQHNIVSGLNDELTEKKKQEIHQLEENIEARMSKSRVTAVITGVALLITLILAFSGSVFFGIVSAVLACVCGYNIYQLKSALNNEKAAALSTIEARYKDKQNSIEGDIKRICAEAVRMSKLVEEKSKDEFITRRLLDELSPELYIAKYEDDKKHSVMV